MGERARAYICTNARLRSHVHTSVANEQTALLKTFLLLSGRSVTANFGIGGYEPSFVRKMEEEMQVKMWVVRGMCRHTSEEK